MENKEYQKQLGNVIKVTELNKYYGDFEMTVRAYQENGQYTAELLFEFDENNIDNTGGSETLHLYDSIEELNEELIHHSVVITLGDTNLIERKKIKNGLKKIKMTKNNTVILYVPFNDVDNLEREHQDLDLGWIEVTGEWAMKKLHEYGYSSLDEFKSEYTTETTDGWYFSAKQDNALINFGTDLDQ